MLDLTELQLPIFALVFTRPIVTVLFQSIPSLVNVSLIAPNKLDALALSSLVVTYKYQSFHSTFLLLFTPKVLIETAFIL